VSANKLKLYMRGVAVLALLIIGGVGVYKGRAMLGTKPAVPDIADVSGEKPGDSKPGDAKTTAKPAAAKPVEPGKTVPSLAANTGASKLSEKPDAPKKPAFGGNFGKDKPTVAPASAAVTTKPGDEKKPGGGGFKFGGPKTEKAKPALARPQDTASEYSLDDSAPATSPKKKFGNGSATTTKLTDEGDGYAGTDTPAGDDGYGGGDATPAAPIVDGDDPIDGYGDLVPTAPAELPSGSRPKGLAGTGAPPKNTIPKASAGGPAARLGSLSDPPSELIETAPKKLPPTNRTASGSLDTSLPSREAPTADRFSSDTDVTPIAQGTPVEPHMTGLQTPSIAVEKFAPEEVQVGKPATFEIVVKNVGKVPAYDVTVTDEVPRGTRFRQANPQPTQSKTGGLAWKLGVMKPGEERVIELQLVPEMEGEIGSVAQVTFQAQAGVKSIVTQPRLEIRHEAPQQIHAGDVATVRLTITNSGTGAASNLLLASEVPEGFSHDAGNSLETKVNPLRPGESTQINLSMKAVKAGQFQQTFSVEEEDGKVVAQDAANIEVVAPGLQVGITGPKKRFVERQATHNITIANPGTASAKDVDLVAYLPRGFKFVSAAPAEAGGQYDARQHAVIWGLEELAAGSSATVQLSTLPIEAGEQKVRVEARSANGLAADYDQIVSVDAVSELPFTIHDLADPIEIGSETAYEIRLSNRGAKDATNVMISVAFPPDLRALGGEGAARATVTGNRVEFAPMGRVAPGQEAVFKVRAEGLRAGDHRIAVSLTSDDQQQPITREESTRVYADQ
jgi:uncharacterized repeat protein (TIGR01451 family)